jgi:hypothetical protein
MNDTSLADMPLYTHLDRIARGLAAVGIGPKDAIAPEQLFALDQWHYHGTDAIRAAADWLELGPTSRVLDVGAGIGGPARYLAHTTGCRVRALEIQPELNAIAVDLTRQSGLGERITHICGDALTNLSAWPGWPLRRYERHAASLGFRKRVWAGLRRRNESHKPRLPPETPVSAGSYATVVEPETGLTDTRPTPGMRCSCFSTPRAPRTENRSPTSNVLVVMPACSYPRRKSFAAKLTIVSVVATLGAAAG